MLFIIFIINSVGCILIKRYPVYSKTSSEQISVRGTFEQFKKRFDQLDKSLVQNFIESSMGLTPFHMCLDLIDNEQHQPRDKIAYLLQNLKRLGLDPNTQYSPNFKGMPEFYIWKNSPISHALAYENFALAAFFLETAKKEKVFLNLNLKDKSGKTPFMFAIKLARTPLSLIKELLTNENYNTPDQYGTTPIMLATALRRKDIVELIIQKKKELLGITKDACTEAQKLKLQEFIHQKHPTSGKTLAYFAILRAGTLKDFSKEQSDYQETVLNILKEAGIEGFRDEHAAWNCLTNTSREPMLIIKQLPGTPSYLTHSCENDFSQKVYLNAKNNIEMFIKVGIDDLAGMEHLKLLVKSYSGRALSDSILARSSEMLEYLSEYDFNFSLKQSNGKTLLDYLQGLLINSDNSMLVCKADVDHLVSLAPLIKKLLPQPKSSSESKEQKETAKPNLF